MVKQCSYEQDSIVDDYGDCVSNLLMCIFPFTECVSLCNRVCVMEQPLLFWPVKKLVPDTTSLLLQDS